MGVRARAPFRIRQLLTENDKAFTDRLQSKRRAPSGEPVFDKPCAEAGSEHRLPLVCRPQTNGMVGCFNGRISNVLASHRFDSQEVLAITLKRYCHPYNHHIPQNALNHRAAIQALKDW